jgi:hypothetical protein
MREIFYVCFVSIMGYHAVDWLCCTYKMIGKIYLYMYGNYVTLVPTNLFNVVYLNCIRNSTYVLSRYRFWYLSFTVVSLMVPHLYSMLCPKNVQKFSLGLVHYFYSMWFINVQKLQFWYHIDVNKNVSLLVSRF